MCVCGFKGWKLLLALAIIMNLGEAQRSSYAPRPGTNYKLLPRFRKNETDSGLGARGGQENSESTTSTTIPPELQGTLEDHRFVHRVSQWPEDRQPFWFKNRNAISSMRDRNIDGGNIEQPGTENERPRPSFQSSFQGPGRGRGQGQGKGRGRGQGQGKGRGRGGDAAEFAPSETFYNDDFMMDPFLYRFRNRYY